MPGFDRTGPMGAGPMTGGRRGFCNPASAGFGPAYGGYGYYGRGLGLRRSFRGGYGAGPGRGYAQWCRWYPPAAGAFYPPVYPSGAADEMDVLKEQAEYMKNSLDAINRRIEALEKQSSE